jgi:hypothetical protein
MRIRKGREDEKQEKGRMRREGWKGGWLRFGRDIKFCWMERVG